MLAAAELETGSGQPEDVKMVAGNTTGYGDGWNWKTRDRRLIQEGTGDMKKLALVAGEEGGRREGRG